MTEINSPLLTRINDLESQLAADREAHEKTKLTVAELDFGAGGVLSSLREEREVREKAEAACAEMVDDYRNYAEQYHDDSEHEGDFEDCAMKACVIAVRLLSANSGSHLLAELRELREKVRGYETGCERTGEHLVRVLKAGDELAERARGLLVELSYCGEPDPERTEKAVESVRDAEDSYRKARGR